MTILGVVIVVLLLACVVLSGLALYRFVVVPSRRSTRYAISKEFSSDEILRTQPLSRFLGLQSSGAGAEQVLGTLVLTQTKLWFHKHDTEGAILDIPLETIEDVSLIREHLGTVTGQPLLLVRFAGPAGPDGVAFHLPYPEEWQLAINNVRSS